MNHTPLENLIHLYEDGALKRRDVIRRLTSLTGSLAATVAALESVGLAQAPTATCPAGTQVPETDPTLVNESLTIGGLGGPLFVYQSRPADFSVGPLPMVLVIHENQGITPYIKDVTRRIGKAGYIGIAVDLLSRQGGTDKFPDPADAVAAYNRTQLSERIEDMVSAIETFRQQPYIKGNRVGTIGFCAGGGNVLSLVSATDKLTAAAVYYGPAPNPVDALARINASMLLIYPELDKGTTTPLPNVLTTLIGANKRYELHVYAGVNHAFHNDTGPRYDPVAACDAWAKTLAFFGRTLNA